MFTRHRLHKPSWDNKGAGLLRAAGKGASREEWLSEAIEELKGREEASRIGVWLELPFGTTAREDSLVFHGQVWDREMPGVPKEWTSLSPAAPLPSEALNSGKSIECGFGGQEFGPDLGPLLELQRAFWVPVMKRRILCGLVLVGTREKLKPLPRGAAERVAAELGTLLELEEERRLARERQADLGLVQELEALHAAGESAGSVFTRLAESCTKQSAKCGAGAVFALIGERHGGLLETTPNAAGEQERLVVLGQSGDRAWAHSVKQGPLENLWRQAVETGRVVGGDAGRLPLAKEISRIVAIPLRGKKEICGVLMAGLPRYKESCGVLERLELRALLAAQFLEDKRRDEQELRARSWQKALLESSEDAKVLVDCYGFLHGMSHGAKELARSVDSAVSGMPGEGRFAELFQPKDWEEVNRWAKSAFGIGKSAPEEPFEAELRGGSPVRLRRLAIWENEILAVGLERVKEQASPLRAGHWEEEFQQTLEWLEEGVVVFNECGSIRALNGRFLQIVGLNEEERAELKSVEDLRERIAKNATNPESFTSGWKRFEEAMEEESREEITME
jgi:PAS domain-containing protein